MPDVNVADPAVSPRGPARLGDDQLRVRPATAADGEGLAALFVTSVGGTFEEHRQGFTRELSSARKDNLILVAEVEAAVVGFARARRFDRPPGSPENTIPPGWYLLGVVVAPPYRRRGVGTALTRARLRWIAERAGEAYYFTKEENHPSIALHEGFGFVEVERDVAFPQSLESAGTRVLYRLGLSGRGER